ncbi:hypothetical protein BGZ61DRAFT_50963 [Ilyonectria robusta]|uniref:uncharacterized protein n=1 Tax=Ilyonectria robusta TaxID=1079257 RepID=UPI001E8CE89B|nr:uncharacterized protein BGZ61DRAFT_50963 [Ilyonectria robusta]KAH8648713.1 hypothetical protein BGZ61DRAFT_50963 [Ilyonectria robusta]
MGRAKQTLITTGDVIQSFLNTPSTPADQAVDKATPGRPKQRRVELAFATWRTYPRIPWFKTIRPIFWTFSLVL